MTVVKRSGEKKNKTVPLFIVPLAKYKAKIYMMPHKKMPVDGELYYVMEFKSGKWSTKPIGDESLKKFINIKPNLVKNYSFEKTTKAFKRYITWSGRTEVEDWTLQDFAQKYSRFNNIESKLSCLI